MSLSINDAQVFGAALKKARKKKHLTQAQCAELPYLQDTGYLCG